MDKRYQRERERERERAANEHVAREVARLRPDLVGVEERARSLRAHVDAMLADGFPPPSPEQVERIAAVVERNARPVARALAEYRALRRRILDDLGAG